MSKKDWIIEIEHLLKKDDTNTLTGIEYIVEANGEEYALIEFRNSFYKKCITANSKAVTLIEIVKAVYF